MALQEATSALVTSTDWTLHLGIHRGTITSRDAESPKPLKSLKACRTEASRAEQQYQQIGCQIWFCYAVGPNDKRVTLIEGVPYES